MCIRDSDKAFPDNPVLVGHVSLHGAVLNSLALEKYGYSDKTVTPEGGIIIRKPGTNEPYGLIMETAFIPVFSNLPKPTPEQQQQFLKDGQMIFAEAGVTTAQEGATHVPDLKILTDGAKQNGLFIDVISFPFILDAPHILKENPLSQFGKYNNHLKIGGIKITSDGSPQGRTAFFTTPYLLGGPANEKNWVGEPSFPQDSLNAWMKYCYDNNIQVLIHANGDAAIDMLLKAHEFAAGNDLSKDRRTTVIHSQFVRKDQLEKYKAYNIIPSFYTEHTYFFGDTHVENRGMEQASFMSPLNTAFKMGITATNHTDFNVLPIDQMMVVWTAVNRTTRTGVLLGADERVSPYEALKAITINAAHQYFEEGNKGSIKENKLADLVILDQNPLKIDPLKIKDIKVVETIKEGNSIYRE
jgi:predicted amidohydrolase YtcJ